MKNYKIIPLLAIIPFLAGCNVSKSGSAKAPSFAKMGEKVSYEDWAEAMTKNDLLGAWTNPNELHIPSAVATVKRSYVESSKITSNKKVVESYLMSDAYDINMKADMANLRLQFSGTGEHKEEYLREAEEEREIAKEKEELVLQYSDVQVNDENKLYFVSVNMLDKTYSLNANASNYTPAEKKALVENQAVQAVYNYAMPYFFSYLFNNYPNYSVEQKEKYTFYQKGQVFSYTYTDEYSRATTDSNGYVKTITTHKIEEKHQLDATKVETWSYKEFVEDKYETKYLRDQVEYSTARFKGDVLKGSDVTCIDANVKAQDVTIKEVDISGYKENNAH